MRVLKKILSLSEGFSAQVLRYVAFSVYCLFFSSKSERRTTCLPCTSWSTTVFCLSETHELSVLKRLHFFSLFSL